MRGDTPNWIRRVQLNDTIYGACECQKRNAGKFESESESESECKTRQTIWKLTSIVIFIALANGFRLVSLNYGCTNRQRERERPLSLPCHVCCRCQDTVVLWGRSRITAARAIEGKQWPYPETSHRSCRQEAEVKRIHNLLPSICCSWP